VALAIVPEKDYVISRFFLNEERFLNLKAAIDRLKINMESIGVPLVFDQPFQGINKFQELSAYEEYDSHLPGLNYVTIFGFLLKALGIEWESVRPSVKLIAMPEFGDLDKKFNEAQPGSSLILKPDVPSGRALQVDGAESFADPLSNTWQDFWNESPIIEKSVCILGDSHSSIFAQRKLTYLFANTFQSVHFEWNPCGTRKLSDVSKYDIVVLEISSRFIV
jgi:hypothetical protein